MNRMIFTLLMVFVSSISINSYADKSIEQLSPELRVLLKQEMLAVQEGMQKMVPAFVSGNYKEVSEVAGKIKNSFIMKQKITSEQKHELHKKLPKDFIVKDKQFHKYAGMLQHVSEEGHTELVSFYYSKLLDSCVGCHSVHAKHRFPLFRNAVEKSGHHH